MAKNPCEEELKRVKKNIYITKVITKLSAHHIDKENMRRLEENLPFMDRALMDKLFKGVDSPYRRFTFEVMNELSRSPDDAQAIIETLGVICMALDFLAEDLSLKKAK
jgi:hypothetical protein